MGQLGACLKIHGTHGPKVCAESTLLKQIPFILVRFILPLFVLAAVCATGLWGGGFSGLRRPWLLLAGAGLLLPRVRLGRVRQVQFAIGLYLCCVVVAGGAGAEFSAELGGYRVNASAGVILLPILGVLWAFGRRFAKPPVAAEGLTRLPAWGVVLVVLGLHAAGLALLLHATHGFGYEESADMLGQCLLLGIACMVFSQPLRWLGARRILAILIGLSFLLAWMGVGS